MDSMAVANPCLQRNWGEWKREMEEKKRRRWRDRASCLAEVEVTAAGEEKKDNGKEEENMVSEEEDMSEEEGENEGEEEAEEWEVEMEVKVVEEIEDEKKEEGNKVARGTKENKKGDEDENSELTEADERIDKKEKNETETEVEGKENEEVTADEVKKAQKLGGGEDERENEVQWKLMGSEDLLEEEESEVKEAKTEEEAKERKNEVEMEVNMDGEVEEKEAMKREQMKEVKSKVEREVKDEKDENKAPRDKQIEMGDYGEEHQEQDQTGEYPLGELSREQIRTEDENIHQNQESKTQDDKIQKDSDSVESVNNRDSDSTGCKDICYNFERIKDEEQYLQTQYEDPEKLQDPENHISRTWTAVERNEGEDSEKLTDAETVAVSLTTQEEDYQEEDESADDDEQYSMDENENSNDEDVVKIYSKDHYYADIFHVMTEFKDSSLLTDLTLSTNDGKSFHVHSPVLAAVSSLIWGQLSRSTGRKDDGTCVGVSHRWSVSLGPEVDDVGLGAVVEFAYTGLISCLNKETVEQVKTAAQTLGAPRVLRLCTEEEEMSTKTGEQKKEERILAAEQMMISLQSIKQLWMDRVGCDVILKALGESIHVHRVILAASSDYFRGMFTLGMKESHQLCVTLPFLLAPELEVLISSSYSGALPLSWKCVFEITSTAIQLQYQPALSLCFNFVQQEINPHSCLDVASFAEAYEMAQLLEVADDFVLRHFQNVACTSKFKDLPAKQLLKYLNSHSLCVPSELVVFKAVVAWIQAKPKKRLKLAKELMKMIHFPLMTFKEFKEVQSLNMWSDHTELYEAIFQDFCSNDIAPQSQCRIYMPKESLILIGGDQISEDMGSRSISREVWFGNSLRNHTGIKKAMEWRKLSEMPEPARFTHEVAVLKGQLYVFGGKKYYGTNDTLNSVYRYDPLQNSWENLAEMQERRCAFSVVVLDARIYAIGGFCNPEYLDSVEQYCPTANSWSFTSPLDLPLRGHVAKVLQGKIFISGGQNNDYQSLASMLLYHPETGSTYLSNMSTSRAHHCMETLGECLYVAGGVTTDHNMTIVDQLDCEVYNPAADSWTVFTSLRVPHVGAGSAVLEGKFYVLGGYSQEDYSDTKMVHRYDPTLQKWENMGKMPGPNNDIRASVLSLPSHLRL